MFWRAHFTSPRLGTVPALFPLSVSVLPGSSPSILAPCHPAGRPPPIVGTLSTPDTWAEKLESLERINSIRETNGNFDSCNSCKRLDEKQTEILTHVTHANGWEPAVYMSYMSQNFRLFLLSNLSDLNFLIVLLMYPGSLSCKPSCRDWPAGLDSSVSRPLVSVGRRPPTAGPSGPPSS